MARFNPILSFKDGRNITNSCCQHYKNYLFISGSFDFPDENVRNPLHPTSSKLLKIQNHNNLSNFI